MYQSWKDISDKVRKVDRGKNLKTKQEKKPQYII